jgi:hypothetical protein
MLTRVADEVGLPQPSSVIGSSGNTQRQLLALTYRVLEEARKAVQWPQLSREHSITLVDSQANYALPTDIDYQHYNTHWSDDDNWEVIGPISSQEWQQRVRGAISTGPRQRFRIKGWLDNQFFLWPTPGTGEAGKVLYFEYQSTQAMRPQTWVTATAYNTGDYVWYNGNVYTADAGGTSGGTAPTHTSGSTSDGGIAWTYSSDDYTQFLADTDVCKIHEDTIGLGVQWMWKRAKGLSYQGLQGDFYKQLKRQSVALRGAKSLYMTRIEHPTFISSENVPDTGYGT